MFGRIKNVVKFASFKKLKVRWLPCPICGNHFHVHLGDELIWRRCVKCGASEITQALAFVVKNECPELSQLSIYEMSSRGRFVNWLRAQSGSLVTSEYMPDVANGEMHGGVRCEDVQKLTFADASFDLVTSTEVFEHVADDAAGFSQVRRVLRPGGKFIFTACIGGAADTVERARIVDGNTEHLLEPEYHGDPFLDGGQVLCLRNYGADIVHRLREAGFSRARLVRPTPDTHYASRVAVAER